MVSGILFQILCVGLPTIPLLYGALYDIMRNGGTEVKVSSFWDTYYSAYTLYLILAATHHDALPVFSSVMIWFVIPLTVIVLIVTVYQQSFKKVIKDRRGSF